VIGPESLRAGWIGERRSLLVDGVIAVMAGS